MSDVETRFSLRDLVTGTLNRINRGTLDYTRNLRDLRRTADQTWSSIKTGASMAGVALTGLTSIGITNGIKMASELEAYRMTLETVMKDTKKAGEIMQWAAKHPIFNAVLLPYLL